MLTDQAGSGAGADDLGGVCIDRIGIMPDMPIASPLPPDPTDRPALGKPRCRLVELDDRSPLSPVGRACGLTRVFVRCLYLRGARGEEGGCERPAVPPAEVDMDEDEMVSGKADSTGGSV